MPLSREEKEEMCRKHYEEYKRYAERIGVAALLQHIPAKPEELKKAYEEDPVLNNIPLKMWEFRHHAIDYIRAANNIRPIGGWSRSQSICLLKHVAIFHVVGDTYENHVARRIPADGAERL